MSDRAILFVDGNNWYHALKRLGVPDLLCLDYAKISRKLVGPRDWVETRYYIGQLRQENDSKVYADQRRFLKRLTDTDSRISIHLGRLESRRAEDVTAKRLRKYLENPPVPIDPRVRLDLERIAGRQGRSVFVEKAVDVMLAVDMVVLAERDGLDAAYLLSADGDFTPAVAAVCSKGKKVYAASPAFGSMLASAANAFIRMGRSWFDDCYG